MKLEGMIWAQRPAKRKQAPSRKAAKKSKQKSKQKTKRARTR